MRVGELLTNLLLRMLPILVNSGEAPFELFGVTQDSPIEFSHAAVSLLACADLFDKFVTHSKIALNQAEDVARKAAGHGALL